MSNRLSAQQLQPMAAAVFVVSSASRIDLSAQQLQPIAAAVFVVSSASRIDPAL